MPKRNRTNESRKAGGPWVSTPATESESEQARAARLFTDSVRQHEAADRAERERKDQAVARKEQHAQLQRAKQDAAGVIKRLRESGRPRDKMAEAEATYRAATAALLEFETGERPHWAAALVDEADEADQADAPDGPGDTVESEGDQPV